MRAAFFPVLVFAALTVFSQDLPGGLTESQSREWLKDNWYTGKHRTLQYDSARIYMYGFIDNYNDSIECVYSGYKKKLAYGTNDETFPAPINCEHTVPQSFFSSQVPELSDIFHMFPTYEEWNNDRSSFPFTDIPDAQTNKWIYKNNSQSSIPSTNINLYSEYRTGTSFEPREQHKGNLARAVFYFFTVYDPSSHNITDVASVNTLCTWARNDVPDAREIERNNRIEQFQGNRNPYIDHPEWLMQAWGCTGIPSAVKRHVADQLNIYPNPAGNRLFVAIEGKFSGAKMAIYSMSGHKVKEIENISPGQIEIDLAAFETGLYLLELQAEDGTKGEAVFSKN